MRLLDRWLCRLSGHRWTSRYSYYFKRPIHRCYRCGATNYPLDTTSQLH